MRGGLTLKPSYYQALKRLTLELSGVNLGEDHAFLVETRLSSLARKEGFESLTAMVEELFSTGETRLAVQVVSSLLERDTHFYDDFSGFETMVKRVIPALMKASGRKSFRILSFGCSSGQETYCIAMTLDKMKAELAGATFEILGVDYPSSALDRAREGRYTHFEVQRGLPVRDLITYFKRKGEDWIVKKPLRDMVSFSDVHLLSKLDELGQFDLVLFRNSLTHYSSPAQVRVLRGLTQTVKYEGYLMLGSQETLNHINYGFDKVAGAPGVYRRHEEKIEPYVDPTLKIPTGRKTFEKAKKRTSQLTGTKRGAA